MRGGEEVEEGEGIIINDHHHHGVRDEEKSVDIREEERAEI